MRHAPQRIRNFLRAYYVVALDQGTAETAAPEMPSVAEIAACRWLTEAELQVYADEYARNGFQGGLQWYRCAVDPKSVRELQTHSDRRIDVPSCFSAGAHDWGVYQHRGDFAKMQTAVCARMQGVHLVENAGDRVLQEQAPATARLLLEFLQRTSEHRDG